MSSSGLKITDTADGFHSLYHHNLDEHYHSIHGAYREAMHVFIKAGFEYVLEGKKSLSIFEMGLGTGLNALLTFLACPKELKLKYHALEAFPLQLEHVLKLNHVSQLGGDLSKFYFEQIHGLEWDREFELMSGIQFCKYRDELQGFKVSESYDLIYFDAFGPRVQPELWTIPVFQKMHESLNENGVLVTYCAKGEVKRNMLAAGFKVEAMEGPPGKREMTRAIKN